MRGSVMGAAARGWAAGKESTPAVALSRLLFWAVLLGIAAWTVLQFLGLGVGGSFEFWGVGRAMAMLECLMLVSLMLNARRLLRPSAMTLAVLTWSPWVFANVAVSVDGDFFEWLLGGAMPALLWPLTYLFFYAQAQTSARAVATMQRYFLVLGLASVALFAAAFREVNANPVRGLQQMNAVYYPLMILPWMLVVRKPAWRVVGVVAVVVAVIFSLKRTAIVAAGATSLVYVVGSMLHARSLRLRQLLLIAAIGGAAWLVYDTAGTTIGTAVAGRFMDIREDEGSGRITIYSEVLDVLKSAEAGNLVFGHGHYSSLERFGVTAHNDFLEVTFGYGLIGLILYVWLHVCLVRKARALYRGGSPYSVPFVASYVLFLIVSMTSHLIIYPTYFAYLAAFWGAVEGADRVSRGSRAVNDRLRRGTSA